MLYQIGIPVCLFSLLQTSDPATLDEQLLHTHKIKSEVRKARNWTKVLQCGTRIFRMAYQIPSSLSQIRALLIRRLVLVCERTYISTDFTTLQGGLRLGVEGCMEKQHCAASHKQRGSLKREDGMTYQHSELNVVRDAINRGTFYPTPPRPLTK